MPARPPYSSMTINRCCRCSRESVEDLVEGGRFDDKMDGAHERGQLDLLTILGKGGQDVATQ